MISSPKFISSNYHTMKNSKISNSQCLMKSSTPCFKGSPSKAAVKPLSFPHALFLIALLAGQCIGEEQEGDYVAAATSSAPMVKSEEDAFYNVLQAINAELDWRALYPDPCGGSSPQGASCDELDGVWHFTSLSFGAVYENTPPCASNARIHASIAQLTHLRSLSFYRCFTGANTSIPAEMGSLKGSLKTLSFRDNGALGGDIPTTFGGLLSLERLVITGAKIEGSIPRELGQLKDLLQLDLSNNKLGGGIPSSFGIKLRKLVVLDLSKNYLIGNIPPSLGGLASLEKLDISRNMLEGKIPLEIGFLLRLNLMDMSFNMVGGNIPSSFGRLSSLQTLDLSHNSFNGALPTSIWGSLRHLLSLDLSNAGFQGPIPSSFASLESLRWLSLANNELTGGIPLGLERLSHLYLLHLDGNDLSGHLPFTPAFVDKLGSNLLLHGNNELCSMVRGVRQGVDNVKICPITNSSEDVHQLSSPSASFSHLQERSSVAPRPFPTLFLHTLSIICILLFMRLSS